MGKTDFIRLNLQKKVDRHFKKGLSFIIDEVESLMFLIEEEVFFGFKYGKNRFYKTKSSKKSGQAL